MQHEREPELHRTRIFLITPDDYELSSFATTLENVLLAGDVASVLVLPTESAPYSEVAKTLIPIVQAHDAAALLYNDSQLMGRTGADGLLLDGNLDDIVETVKTHAGRQIMGVANIRSRHDAMVIGEGPVDFLFFGRLDGDTNADIFPKSFKLAEWWSSLFQIPAVIMGGNNVESVEQASVEGIDFIALRDAIWNADNAVDALSRANSLLDKSFEDRKSFMLDERL